MTRQNVPSVTSSARRREGRSAAEAPDHLPAEVREDDVVLRRVDEVEHLRGLHDGDRPPEVVLGDRVDVERFIVPSWSARISKRPRISPMGTAGRGTTGPAGRRPGGLVAAAAPLVLGFGQVDCVTTSWIRSTIRRKSSFRYSRGWGTVFTISRRTVPGCVPMTTTRSATKTASSMSCVMMRTDGRSLARWSPAGRPPGGESRR